jgi:hypothetical protein
LQGQLDWKDVISALLIAIFATVSNSIADLIVNGAVDWVSLKNIVIGVVCTYLSTTFFVGAPKAI